MGDESGKLVAGHPVVAGDEKVERQFLGPVEGDQGGDGRDAPIARAQCRIGPHLAVQRVADEFGESGGVKSGAFSCVDGSGVLMRIPSLPVCRCAQPRLAAARGERLTHDDLGVQGRLAPVVAGGGGVIGCGGPEPATPQAHRSTL